MLNSQTGGSAKRDLSPASSMKASVAVSRLPYATPRANTVLAISGETTPGTKKTMPMYLNPCSTRNGLRASARSRLLTAGQIYCVATTLQKRRPKATVMYQMRGIGMMRSFLHLARQTARRVTHLHDAAMCQRDSGAFRFLPASCRDTLKDGAGAG